MLKFITGAVHTKRDDIFCECVKNAAASGEDVLVIMPDQFSFECDKKLYDTLGAVNFNRISTAGFNRLAQLISAKYGAGSRDNATENAKIITMYKAVCRLKETRDVRFYKRSLDKGTFLAEVISMVSELIQSGVTPNGLRLASEKLEGAVCNKLFDLWRLYELYLEELASAGLKDSLTSLGKCVTLVDEHEYFKGMTVFLDAFSSFTQDEYRLIELMLTQAKSVTVSLVISHSSNAKTNQTPFAQTIRTQSQIERLAMNHNISFTTNSCNSFDYSSPAIEYINKNLYCFSHEKSADSSGVHMLSATEIYEEAEYVCAEISRLVREEGYSYKNIAVAARNLADIAPVLEGVFERYEIPYFLDCRQGVEQSALVIYLKSIFSAVLTREWSTECLLKYTKSPLCAIYDYDVNDLENYCYKWGVEGKMWLSDFTATEGEGEVSEHINKTRCAVIQPLSDFKSTCEGATAKQICKALYTLLDEIQLSHEVYSMVKIASTSSNDTDLELGRITKQIWVTVLSAVQSIYENLGDEKLSLRRFYEIFKLMISQMTVSAPPQKIDSVRCASAQHSRMTDVKALFVLEVNDGVFPADIKPDGLLTEREKRQLEELNISLNSSAMSLIEDERLTVYQTLSMPSDKLYILSSESDTMGKQKNPSVLIKMLLDMFESAKRKEIHKIPDDFFCTSYKTAYYKYLEKSKDRNVNIASIKASIETSAEYAQRLDFVKKSAENKPHSLDVNVAHELFFGHDLNISATRITDFYNCPFSFFCKYGLKLFPPQRVEFNQLFKGNLVHNSLEMMMSKESEGRRVFDDDFLKLTDEQLSVKISSEFANYFNEQMGGEFGKTSRFMHEMSRYERSAFHMVKAIQSELSKSLFRPEAFEFNLTKENEESILRLTLEKGYTINIRGSIDRADIYTDPQGVRYLRIVDYKTGSTDFSLAQLYSGLNLQMMIYLLAVTQSINELNPDGKLKPTAIMYSHLKECPARLSPSDIVGANMDELEKFLFKKRLAEFKPDGMMIDNDIAFKALNRDLNGAFTIFKLKNDGGFDSRGNQPVDESYFSALATFALRKVYELADRLLCGDIKADPVCEGKGMYAKIPCSYCEYWAICGNANPMNPRRILKEDKHKLNAQLDSICQEVKGGEE